MYNYGAYHLFTLLWMATRELGGFPSGSEVQNPPAMQETQVQYLGPEDTLEKGMVTYSSIPTWEIAWTEEPGGLQSMRSQKSRT